MTDMRTSIYFRYKNNIYSVIAFDTRVEIQWYYNSEWITICCTLAI